MTRRTLVLTALSMMVIMGIGYAGDNASQNKIDPQGERILKSMFDDLKDMSSGRIKATDDLELVPSDSTMQIPPTHWEISFVRPGKIRIQTSGNGSSLLASDGHMLRLPEGKGQFNQTICLT